MLLEKSFRFEVSLQSLMGEADLMNFNIINLLPESKFILFLKGNCFGFLFKV